MATTIETISPTVESIIRLTIAEVMAGVPIENITIEAELDHTDDEAIAVEIYHPLLEKDFAPQLETDLLRTVHRRLIDAGEHRFPYITHHHVDP